VLAVGGNEGGFYSTFVTDEAGFNNPKGTWPLGQGPHVFVVGDSFTYGDCVRQGQDVASRLRGPLEQVVNLGARGNGPLQQLASIREYVPAAQVEHVVWMFYERNDLIDLRDAKPDAILMRYLDPAFSQNLWARQQEVNEAVRGYIEERIQKERQEQPRLFPGLRAKIKEIAPRRADANAHGEGAESRSPKDEAPDFVLLKEVLSLAKSEVEVKGGKMLFVYLPSYRRFTGEPLNPWADHKDKVMETVRSLGIPAIDVEPEFRKTADPLSLFPFRLNGHYNEAGYALVARVVADRLRRGGP
jgi:hypothetical protein